MYQSIARFKKRFERETPGLYKRLRSLYWLPVHTINDLCRKYYWMHDLRGALTGYRKERERLAQTLGYYPDIRNPQTLNEKVLWKKLFVRDPLLTRTADKLKVRGYVREKLGVEADDLLIPLLQVSKNAANLDLDRLEPPYVIKTNHGSSTNLFVDERLSPTTFLVSEETTAPRPWTTDEIVHQLDVWMKTAYAWDTYEWAYQNIDRMILVEPKIDASGIIDVKIFCFEGMPKLAIVSTDRGAKYSIIDINGIRIDATYKNKPQVEPDVIESVRSKIEIIKRISGVLSSDFEFVRIDFYHANNKLLIGEITHYPAGGSRRFEPPKIYESNGPLYKLENYKYTYLNNTGLNLVKILNT